MANKEGKNKIDSGMRRNNRDNKKKTTIKNQKKKETNSFLHTVAPTQVKQATLWGSAPQVTTAFARTLIILR